MNEIEKFEKEIDCKEYSVILTNTSIRFKKYSGKDDDKGKKIFYECMIPSHFDISIDRQEDGGKIEINFKDRWGSSMRFIHYMPSDLKGMFDFIAKGYNVELITNKDFKL